MMLDRFTRTARRVVVVAQEDARRLGHDHVGCEHLLLAAAATDEPASAVLRDHGVTPDRIEAAMLRTLGPGQTADPLGGLDKEALASIGIDLDVVRARIEATFGPDALTWALPAARQSRRPAWGKGPLAELKRRRHRHGRRSDPQPASPHGTAMPIPGPAPRGHIPFTPRAKKSLQLSLREAEALHDNYIGVQHLILALLGLKDGTVPVILSALGAPAAPVRAAILTRYRKAS
jgi:ATP-dependent Clp protease ATP-binding subunit ClpA